MSGEEFLCRYPVAWTPWNYLYREKMILRETTFPVKSGDRLVDFSSEYPRIVAAFATIMRPILNLAWLMKKRLK